MHKSNPLCTIRILYANIFLHTLKEVYVLRTNNALWNGMVRIYQHEFKMDYSLRLLTKRTSNLAIPTVCQ